MALTVKKKLIARVGDGNRVILRQWSDDSWSYALVEKTSQGYSVIGRGEQLLSRDDAQAAVINAIRQLPEQQRKAFPGKMEWTVSAELGLGKSHRFVESLKLSQRRSKEAFFGQALALLLALAASVMSFVVMRPLFGHDENRFVNEQLLQQQARITRLTNELTLLTMSQSAKAREPDVQVASTLAGNSL